MHARLGRESVVVTVFPDDNKKYLSTDLLREEPVRGDYLTNPVRGVRHRIENNARVRFLSEGEESRLFAYLEANFPERKREVLVALHSGRSEQYLTSECPEGGLKWGNVDFRNGLLTIPRSKHGGIRHIPMNSVLRNALLDLRKHATSDYVFPGEIPSRWFTEACKKIEMRDFTWHSLRHTLPAVWSWPGSIFAPYRS